MYVLFLSEQQRVTVKSHTWKINSSTANGPASLPAVCLVTRFGNVPWRALGDLDGDGVGDLAVGADRDDEGGSERGAVHVLFLHADGSVKSTVEINSSTPNGLTLSNRDYFGGSVASLGDLDGDGVADLAVGAYGDDEGGTYRGAVHVLFLDADGSVKSTVEINSSTPNAPTLSDPDRFGSSVTSVGDLDGDGVADLAVGAYRDDEGGSLRGAVHVLFLAPLPPPEINLQGMGQDIADGDNAPETADDTDFGSATVGSSAVVHTFTIQNTGDADLELTATPIVAITGSSDFSVSAQPASSTVGASGSTTFDVTFTPTTVGIQTATISIANDDSDEAPYDFVLQGTVTAPEINLQGMGQDIADGDNAPETADDTDFGSAKVGSSAVVHTFTIENTGDADLELTGTPIVAITGSSDFSVSAQPASSTVGASGSTTFDVTFTPTTVGIQTATISIDNDDGDENPYDFVLQGTVTAPEVNLQGMGQDIADGDNAPETADDTDFGSAKVGSSAVVHTFTIENTGDADLELTATPIVAITGSSDFAVSAQPASSTVGASGSTTFDVTFTPTTVGIQTATISIANDDSDEDPYDFELQGIVIGFDFGDAPDPLVATDGEYPTLLANDGARHAVPSAGATLFLGTAIDTESDGQPNGTATGDDTDADGDDEDGVIFSTPLIRGETVDVDVTVTDTLGVGGFLDAWIDFDQDGVFSAGEKVIGQASVAGTTPVSMDIPAGALLGDTFARFRLNSAGNLPPDGAAIDGEVEDYLVTIQEGGIWEAATELFHLIGRADGDGWSADPAQDSPGFLTFGPYVVDVPSGQHTAAFRLKVDDVSADNLPVVKVDVHHFTTSQILAERIVHRSEFTRADTYQTVDLTFGYETGGELEFRVYWYGNALVTQQQAQLELFTSIAPDPEDCPVHFEAESDLNHVIGRADGAGWSANVADDAPGYLSFGPYTPVVPAGQHTVAWELMVDNNTADNVPVVTVDVFDAGRGELLAQRIIRRGEFTSALTYEPFFVDFTSEQASTLEFRVFWHGTSYVNMDKATVHVTHVLQAEHAFDHDIGQTDGDGWLASVAADAAGFLASGPTTTYVAKGEHVASFDLKVDDNTSDNLSVVTIDVWDATAGVVLAGRDILRGEFDATSTYQTFGLDFSTEMDRALQFRTYWHDRADVTLDSVTLDKNSALPVDTSSPLAVYEADTLFHQIGSGTGSDWFADTALDAAGFLSYGPYTGTVPSGTHAASFRLQIDDNTSDNEPVATIDVSDAALGQLLARRVGVSCAAGSRAASSAHIRRRSAR